MNKLVTASKWFVLAFVTLLLVRTIVVDNVELGHVGVRRSNIGGVHDSDLGPGWRLEIAGLHKIIELPSTYQIQNFLEREALEIRTKDNNIVTLDISVPYRITPGSAWEIVSAGNHVEDGQGSFRFQRLTRETTVGVLRQHLGDLQSSDFYDTDRRNLVSAKALEILNAELAPLHVEANAILMRAVFFRPEYESQLLQIQLNAQNKLLDGARTEVADRQQQLDNFQQKTRAMAASKTQDWAARLARIDRAYNVGFLAIKPAVGASPVLPQVPPDAETPSDAETPDAETSPEGEALAALSPEEIAELEQLAAQSIDLEPGAARRKLEELTPAQKTVLLTAASDALGGAPEEYGDNYLLGIKNIQAETLAYDLRVRADADGVSARLDAEGKALIAAVVGNFESRINQLLASDAGRAFVAWQAAANVKFAEELTFHSSDGIPSVLHLREFARAFMGD
jgi:regulator of protease activity HflC (stomatin/prohibitin superfamily)/plasmid stability protein